MPWSWRPGRLTRHQPDGELRAVARHGPERRLERLGAGVRVARDGRSGRAPRRVGEQQLLHLLGAREDGVREAPAGGDTVTARMVSPPASMNWVGVWDTSDSVATNSTQRDAHASPSG